MTDRERRPETTEDGLIAAAGATLSRLARRGPLASPLVVPVTLTVASLAFWLHAHADVPFTLWWTDEQQWGQLARRLAAGEGFTTGLIYPMELSYGSGPDHPSVLRPPLWSLILAGVFRLTGPVAWAAHALVAAFYVATVVATGMLATRLAGRGVGLIAGIASAASPYLLTYALGATPTTALAFWIVLAFLLLALPRAGARGVGAEGPGTGIGGVWIGAVCGLAYLTRYNAAVLLPVALALLLLRRPVALRPVLLAVVGFAGVAAPWWIRNALVTGNPFVSYGEVYLHMPAVWSHDSANLWRMLDPLAAPAATPPLEKLRTSLPRVLIHWPLLAAGLTASIGVALGGLRRDRISLGFLALAALTTLSLVLTIVSARYFAPLVPCLIAVGAAAWWRFGGALRIPALILIIATPLLPAIPAHYHDLRLLHAGFATLRESVRSGVYSDDAIEASDEALRGCLSGRPLVIAEQASRTAWVTDAVVIYRPVLAKDFWRVLDEHPVEWVELERGRRGFATAAFDERFEPRPECGPNIYRRRSGPG
jgi:4-amino-4-deoxy-L-arabinose transferase-like glycosyltransferase